MKRATGTDLHTILNIVTGGDEETLRQLAEQLCAKPDREIVAFLAEVAHSGRSRFVRSRSLHLLALIAERADPDARWMVMDALRLDQTEGG